MLCILILVKHGLPADFLSVNCKTNPSSGVGGLAPHSLLAIVSSPKAIHCLYLRNDLIRSVLKM